MRTLILVFAALGSLAQLSAAVIFPITPIPTDNDTPCQLPTTDTLHATIQLKTDSGSVSVVGIPQQGSFLDNGKVYPKLVTQAGVSIQVDINPSFLSNGENKAYVGFVVGTSSGYAGFVTIDVSCTPTSTIKVVPTQQFITTGDATGVSITMAQGSPPASVAMVANVQGQPPADNPNQKSAAFTMRMETLGSVTPWLTSASVPGAQPNQGTVPTPGAVPLTVNVNPTGLLAQSVPYDGYVHILDTHTGYGSADLTVHLSIAGSFTLPHFAANGVLVTGFYIVNNSSSPAGYILSFYDDNGNPIALPIPGQGNQVSATGNIQANGSAYVEVGDPNQPQVGGSVRITGDPTISVQSLFRVHYQDNVLGSRFYEAAVPATVGSKEFLTPFDATKFAPTNDQTFTGIAIANLDSGNSSTVTCVARDSSGNVIPNAVSVPQLAPLGHWAGFNFPALLGLRGTLDCTGTTTIGAIALHSYSTSGALTSLPVILK